jgi:multidrug efflux pump subunit AcrA (membrane-fusion protein)
LSEEEISELEQSSSLDRSLILPEDKMWVYANIYEYELGWVKIGQDARVNSVAYPGEEFKGKIVSISPVLDPNTRSVKVRIQVDNPDLKLKPEMYLDVIIESSYKTPEGEDLVLAVPREGVLDTGTRKIVYLKKDSSEYVGKEVKLGPLATGEIEGVSSKLYPVINGLKEGDIVVTKGNFLIDSQSQLTGGMSVLWGGASEIKEEGRTKQETMPVQTQHKH